MLTALVAGVTFGLSAGFSPGPLSLLVLTQSLRFGAREGARVAFAPLITDAPIVALALALAHGLSQTRNALGVIALVGAMFVVYLAWHTWNAAPPRVERALDEPPRSLLRGAVVNLLSPHPYLFWLSVGAPSLSTAAQRAGVLGAAAFVFGFYLCLVGAKVLMAWLVGQSRGWLLGRAYRWIMRALALMMLIFAALLARDGITLLSA